MDLLKLAAMILAGWALLSLVVGLAWWRIGRALDPQVPLHQPVPDTAGEVYALWALTAPAHDPIRDDRLDDAL